MLQPVILNGELNLPPNQIPQDSLATLFTRPPTKSDYEQTKEVEAQLMAGLVPFSSEWKMDDTQPTTAYRHSSHFFFANSGVHWGQLKLYLSEVEFLAWCMRRFGRDCFKDALVVYAGAADGRHNPMLFELFADLQMELWDPAEFAPEVKEFACKNPTKLRYFNDYFTDEIAQSYATKAQKIFFISDIRRVPSKIRTEESDDRSKELKDEDHYWQAGWVRAIKPLASMLKYSPMYPESGENPIRDYFVGHIRTQAFPGRTSTETRLIFEGVPDFMPYDCKRFEDIAAHHNNIVRTQRLTAGQFFSFVAKMDGGAGRKINFTQSIPFERVKEKIPTAPRGVWQCWGGQPRYDDWRALNIMRDYCITIAAMTDTPVSGPFDVLPAATDRQLQAAVLEGFVLLSQTQEKLRSSSIQQFIQRSKNRMGLLAGGEENVEDVVV